MNDRQGIQSVDAAIRVLRALASHSRPMSLKEIAAASGMTASNTHRYLVSFVRAGMMRQERATERYDLGPFALQLGLASLARMDFIETSSEVLAELRAEIDLPVFLSIWTPEGPVMIRWLDSSHPLTVNTRPGSRAPLLNTASGRIFLAYENESRVRPVLEAELQQRRDRDETQFTTLKEATAIQAEVRAHGLGRTVGERISGVNGISAPIFNAMGDIVASITSVGLAHDFDVSYDGRLAHVIHAAGMRASQQLGFQAKSPAHSQTHNKPSETSHDSNKTRI